MTRSAATTLLLLTAACLAACAPATPPATSTNSSAGHMLHNTKATLGTFLSFESEEQSLTWTPDQPGLNAPLPAIARTQQNAQHGKWSLGITLAGHQNGALTHTFAHPQNFADADLVTLALLQSSGTPRNNDLAAAIRITDDSDHTFTGDFFPVTSTWATIPLDIKSAADAKIDTTHITSVSLVIKWRNAPAALATSPDPLMLQTDEWAAAVNRQAYVGQRIGIPNTFFVQREGTSLHVGVVGNYELTFTDRSGTDAPWLTIQQSPDAATAIGSANTGLLLLDQNQYDTLAQIVRHDAYQSNALQPLDTPAPTPITQSLISWPLTPQTAALPASATWTTSCTWSSPIGALIEVKEKVGPFDAHEEPAATITWQFMIYQWGQVFVHVMWSASDPTIAHLGGPVSWALQTDRSATANDTTTVRGNSPADTGRLLADLYPATLRTGLAAALPDLLQTGAPLGLLAPVPPAALRNTPPWWRATVGSSRLFGVGIPQRNAPMDAMLLLHSPPPLTMAASFSQYLAPPKLKFSQGELDRNYPGDANNDGLVESTGFQTIRLTNGRASFTIYPQDRPLFYLPFLFELPPTENPTDPSLKLIVNIGGKQFTDLPRFTDGNFLLQTPYVLDRPVTVEALLVHQR